MAARIFILKNLQRTSVRYCYTRKGLPDIPELHPPEDRKYLEDVYSQKKGHVYSKKPFKYRCEVGKYYMWCVCGRSHSQPFCDGTHKIPNLRITQVPAKFTPKVTKDYWFCNCKQTKNPPFCDGTHKTEEVQNANSTIKF